MSKKDIRRIKKRQKMSLIAGVISFLICILAIGFLVNKISNKNDQGFVTDTPTQGEEVIDISNEVVKGKIPLFFQYDKRWAKERYGDDIMEIAGCGPTCLSMIVSGLSGKTNYDPLTVAKLVEDKYYVNGAGSSWTLMSEGGELLGLTAQEVIFDENHIRRELEEGRPIVCVVGPGDFTTDGHFIILISINEKNQVRLNDPNSKERSKKLWNLEELMPQIRNLWSFTYE